MRVRAEGIRLPLNQGLVGLNLLAIHEAIQSSRIDLEVLPAFVIFEFLPLHLGLRRRLIWNLWTLARHLLLAGRPAGSQVGLVVVLLIFWHFAGDHDLWRYLHRHVGDFGCPDIARRLGPALPMELGDHLFLGKLRLLLVRSHMAFSCDDGALMVDVVELGGRLVAEAHQLSSFLHQFEFLLLLLLHRPIVVLLERDQVVDLAQA